MGGCGGEDGLAWEAERCCLVLVGGERKNCEGKEEGKE